jgi:AraC-like DNA-binding protein
MGRPPKLTLSAEELKSTLATWLETQQVSGDTARPLAVADAARSLGIAPRTLQHHLTRHGITYRQVVEQKRLCRSRALLAETSTKITSIAIEVGFSSVQHFCVWFKRTTGQRPSEFRGQSFRILPAFGAAGASASL